jgi:hypothetical protein
MTDKDAFKDGFEVHALLCMAIGINASAFCAVLRMAIRSHVL